MAAAYVDRLDVLHLAERNGAVRSLTRKARVVFESAEAVPADYRVLLSALEEAGIPVPFSSLAGEGLGSLILTERGAEVAEQDPRCVDVTLKYDHVLDGPNQLLYNADPENPRPVLYVKGRTSIAQKATNFFRPFGDPDAARVQILTGHTFVDDQDIAGMEFVPGHPNTVYQGGEVTVPFPQTNFHLAGVWDLGAAEPWDIHLRFVRRINDDAWLGRPAYTWLCTEVRHEMLNATLGRYQFEFEFQYDEDTWNPTVVFNDQRTGRPPANVLVADQDDANGVTRLVFNPVPVPGGGPPPLQPAGMWTVPFLVPVNFADLFADVTNGALGPVVR